MTTLSKRRIKQIVENAIDKRIKAGEIPMQTSQHDGEYIDALGEAWKAYIQQSIKATGLLEDAINEYFSKELQAVDPVYKSAIDEILKEHNADALGQAVMAAVNRVTEIDYKWNDKA